MGAEREGESRGERKSIVVVVLVVTGLREAIGAVLVVSVMKVSVWCGVCGC